MIYTDGKPTICSEGTEIKNNPCESKKEIMIYQVVELTKLKNCCENDVYIVEGEAKFNTYKKALKHKTYCESISNNITEYMITVTRGVPECNERIN